MSTTRGNPPGEAIGSLSYGIPIAYAPRDRRILAYGRIAWDGYGEGYLGWAVVEWDPERTWDDDCNPVGGWVVVSRNPYTDHMEATHYTLLPCDPPSPQSGESP